MTDDRFMIVHRTTAHWEGGAKPGPKLIESVGALVGQLAQDGVLRAGEGLGPSALGARVACAGGAVTVTKGPFAAHEESIVDFAIVNVASLDDAVTWATRLGEATGDVEIDVRPVNEPWDIGVGEKPAGLTTTRYMILRKGDAAADAGRPVLDEMKAQGVLTAREAVRPGKRARLVRRTGGFVVLDGPFAESKELVGGYIVLAPTTLDAAVELAGRYIGLVATDQVDVLPVAGG